MRACDPLMELFKITPFMWMELAKLILLISHPVLQQLVGNILTFRGGVTLTNSTPLGWCFLKKEKMEY